MASVQDVANDVQAVQTIADNILKSLSTYEPAAGAVEVGVDLVAPLVTAALTAWSKASGTPVTAASVAALLPDQDPLPLPTE